MDTTIKFSMLPPETQDAAYRKVVNDRDVAMLVAAKMGRRLRLLASYVKIKNGRIVVTEPKIRRGEYNFLAEFLEVEQ